MKTLIRGMVVLFVCILPLAGCGADLADEEVEKATAVSYASWMTAALAAGFGQAPEGVTVSEDNTTVTLDNLDISEFQMGYQTVSGTVVTDEERVVFDMSMTGGPVSTIAYELSVEDINSTAFEVSVTANKKSYDVALSEEDFQ